MKLLVFFHASIIPAFLGEIEAYIYLSLVIAGAYSIIQADFFVFDDKVSL